MQIHFCVSGQDYNTPITFHRVYYLWHTRARLYTDFMDFSEILLQTDRVSSELDKTRYRQEVVGGKSKGGSESQKDQRHLQTAEETEPCR